MSFVHLHVAGAFSAHHGVDRPEVLAAAAAADTTASSGLRALASTDRDGLYGAVKHVGACLEHGLDPVLGVDLALLHPTTRAPQGRVVVLARGTAHPGAGPWEGRSPAPGAGYRALVDLVSAAHGFLRPGVRTTAAPPVQKGRGKAQAPDAAFTSRPPKQGVGSIGIDTATLASCAADSAPGSATDRTGGLNTPAAREAPARLVVLLGPDSDVGRAALRRDYRGARAALQQWKRIMPTGSLAVELVTHLSRPGTPYSTSHAVRMLRVARESGVPAILTNAVRYADPDGAATADVLDAVRALAPLDTEGVRRAAFPGPGTGLGPQPAPGARHHQAGAVPGTPTVTAPTPPPDGAQVNGQGWLKSAAQMRSLAAEIARESGNPTEASRLLHATEALATSCALDPVPDLGWGVPVVPEASVLGLSGDPQAHLRARCEEGLARLLSRGTGSANLGSGGTAGARERLEHELSVIADLGFAGYFLTVATATDLIRDLGVRSAARGSGASSLVAHLTGISHVNPLAHDLVFERFLSRERTSLPDIDVDVESAERHRVYHALFERFGAERTTLMSMQNAYRARGAVRDAGMALGMQAQDVDAVAKGLWRFSASSFREAIGTMPELGPLAARLEADRARGGHQMDLLVDLTERLDRLPRHISMHPCGVILSDAQLLTRTPVQASGLGLPMSQFDKHDMDPMGLLKLDVLGVRMQSTIAHTLTEITRIHPDGAAVYAAGAHGRPSLRGWYEQMGEEGRREYAGVVRGQALPDAAGPGEAPGADVGTGQESPSAPATEAGEAPTAGEPAASGSGDLPPWLGEDGSIDLDRVPLDDEATYEMIRTTNTLGVFQIESPGQRELIGKLAPTEFNDLIIDISLFRPGPMQSDMVRPFLEQRHGFAAEAYPHPDLEPILAETHGVVVFHEQVLRMLDVMTGCGLARADVLRRRLGNPAKEPDVERFFRAEALRRGYDLDIIDKVWRTLAAFGSFGFCKAHGAAFAVPTYHSAWLKTHHPEAFLAGLFEHDPGMYPRRLLIAEARRLGVPLLPLDVNHSGTHFRVEEVPQAHAVEAVPGIRASGRYGIRLAWPLLSGLSAAEASRLESGAPYASVADVRDRARPTRTNLRRLAEIGALDRFLVPGAGGRADLVHHLDAQRSDGLSGAGAARGSGPSARSARTVPRQVDGQLPLPLGVDLETSALTPVFPDPDPVQRVRTELDLTAADLSGHLMAAHHPFLERVGATPSDRLLTLRSGSRVLVAGVRVATQTPPMRSGERVVFISLDDGHGCVDLGFFTRAQHETGPLLFSAQLMLVEGVTRRTGPRAVSVQALRAWDLQDPSAPLPGPDYLAGDGSWRERLRRPGPDELASVPGEGGGWYRGIINTGATAMDLAPSAALAPSRSAARTRVGAAAGRGRPLRPVPWRPGDGSDATGGAGEGLGALGSARVKRAGGMG